ncbi:helix-turn-helix domain-containing protein [Peptoniphilus catoniae]|uniref:helix-turn-helix domain-containing protein n=1 Tax=Peptoniphilus catoniae TaxID=1660341 RepID=UPI0010FE2C89|nr:helix-turn-helix transcriptional regulator [Peptoniphilus catoniae]
MILGEKILKNRKENNWSQEELAMKLNVSRQSISKWEGGTSIPDLDRIIALAKVFGVSTDYLLKDELEEDSLNLPDEGESYEDVKLTNLSLNEANNYLDAVEDAARRLALGVALCILSPIIVLVLTGLSNYKKISMTEDMAGAIGVSILILMVAIAVFTFISTGVNISKYDYLKYDYLSKDYGVDGIVESKKEKFMAVYKKVLPLGVSLCVLSSIPIILTEGFGLNEAYENLSIAFLFVLVALGVYMIINVLVRKGGYDVLLEEGDYTRTRKIEDRKNEAFTKVYWAIALIIYISWSFISFRWEITWIVWPIAGVTYVAMISIINMLRLK